VKIKVDTLLKWNGKDVKLKGVDLTKRGSWETGIGLQDVATQLVPTETGRLKGSIAVRDVSRTKTEGSVQANDLISAPTKIGAAHVGTAVEYARAVEFGTRPHAINSAVLIKGRWVYIKNHPGTQSQAFMRPALDLVTGKVVNIWEKQGKFVFKDYFKEKGD